MANPTATLPVHLPVGAIVRRGNGKTLWRIRELSHGFIGLDPVDGYTRASIPLDQADQLQLISRPHLPYADGCRHASPIDSHCANVYAGRACALDPTKENGFDDQGRAYVRFLSDDTDRGVAAGSEVLAFDPYTGLPSGQKKATR